MNVMNSHDNKPLIAFGVTGKAWFWVSLITFTIILELNYPFIEGYAKSVLE